MRQCVSFKCSVCGQAIQPNMSIFVRVIAPTVIFVKRFCSPACLRGWTGAR